MDHVEWTFNIQLKGIGGQVWVLNPNLVALSDKKETELEVRRSIIHRAMQEGMSVKYIALVKVRLLRDEPPNHPNCRCDLE